MIHASHDLGPTGITVSVQHFAVLHFPIQLDKLNVASAVVLQRHLCMLPRRLRRYHHHGPRQAAPSKIDIGQGEG